MFWKILKIQCIRLLHDCMDTGGRAPKVGASGDAGAVAEWMATDYSRFNHSADYALPIAPSVGANPPSGIGMVSDHFFETVNIQRKDSVIHYFGILQ